MSASVPKRRFQPDKSRRRPQWRNLLRNGTGAHGNSCLGTGQVVCKEEFGLEQTLLDTRARLNHGTGSKRRRVRSPSAPGTGLRLTTAQGSTLLRSRATAPDGRRCRPGAASLDKVPQRRLGIPRWTARRILRSRLFWLNARLQSLWNSAGCEEVRRLRLPAAAVQRGRSTRRTRLVWLDGRQVALAKTRPEGLTERVPVGKRRGLARGGPHRRAARNKARTICSWHSANVGAESRGSIP